MSVYIPSDNKIVTCPYDATHRPKESRYQLHVANCTSRRVLDKKTCPFNKTHVLRPGEFDHHLLNCPDRAALDRQLAQNVDNNNPYKRRTDAPVNYPDPVVTDESWDIEENNFVELPPPPPGAILAAPDMAKPSERKQFYIKLHRLPSEQESDQQPSSSAKSLPVKPPSAPRQPNKLSEGQTQQMPNPQTLQNLGLERGKPTQIAASVPHDTGNSSNSYSRIVKDMSQLGLGRGNPTYQGAAALNNFSEDDFPALGCGRSNNPSNAPKQNSKLPAFKKKSKQKSKNA